MNSLAFVTNKLHGVDLWWAFQRLVIRRKPKSLDAKAKSRQLMKCVSCLMSNSYDSNRNYIVKSKKQSHGKSAESPIVDWAKLKVKAGDGGAGKAHLKRGRGLLGPDGGDGGKGGDVVIIADQSVKQLKGIRRHCTAENGGNGKVDYGKGKKGSDFIIMVPVGTVIMHQDTNEILADLVSTGSSYIVARGGFGGLGNANFKSSTEQRTLMSTDGELGEELSIQLAMKVIADIGLVGFPNAGKSTLLRALSRAKPAVASYPFTTLRPNIGVIDYKDTMQVADIPGLVKDAHLNKGLGHLFLRHIERCSSLLYVVDISEDNFVETYLTLRDELAKYQPELLNLQRIIAANKIDAVENYSQRINLLEHQTDTPVIGISGMNLVNIEKLKTMIRELVRPIETL